jgi:ketosteroid isomerase-like protein
MDGGNPLALVLSLYQGLLSAPEAAIATGLAPDIVWENPLPDAIPFGGRFEGHEGCARYLTHLSDAIEMEDFAIDDTIAEGNRVVLIGRETSRVKKTGRRYTMGWVHVVHVRDGLVTRVHEYNDTAAMAAAFGT